jgi:hypothetical protein
MQTFVCKENAMKETKQSEFSAQVQRENGKVWIKGVPSLGWGTFRETTFVGALEAALAVTEQPYDYATLMGATGLAFRTRWFQGPGPDDRWCPSSPVGEFPEEIGAASRATGWSLRTECLLGEKEPRMERFAPDIMASIDAGLPVLGYDHSLNMAVIFGYEDGGQTVRMYDYFGRETPTRKPTAEIGAMLLFLGERTEPLSRRDALLQGLTIAARNWPRRHDPADHEERGYWFGNLALTKWGEDLGRYDTLSDPEREKLFFVSWWCFDVLADARPAAVTFLRSHADLLEGEAANALQRAAALYQQEGELLGSAFCRKDAFLGPWSGKSIVDWTADVRQREQDLLAQAREIEAAAIAEIEKALAAADR